jgi:hypothetical protein
MTPHVWTLGSGLRVLQIKSPEDVRLLADPDLAFDAVEVGARLQNFEALAEFAPRIKALWHCSVPSVTGLEKLQAIESINSSHDGEQRFDYRLLKTLKTFVCYDGSTIPAKYLNHPVLELLNLGHCKVESFQVLSDATRLRQVRLSACKVRSLDGVQALQALRELRLPEARTLVDIGAISHCVGLEVLEISEAKKLLDLTPITSLHKLRLLFVSAPAAAFDDVQWLSGMPDLRCASIHVPTARIDWAVFGAHPRLYDIAIHSVPGGLTETDAQITSQLEAAGRKVLKLTRFRAGPGIRVELEPVAGTVDPLPSLNYQNFLGQVPPN